MAFTAEELSPSMKSVSTNSLFTNVSPLDHRYRLSHRELFDALSAYLSEEAAVKYHVRVETVLLEEHLRREGKSLPPIVRELEERITAHEVYQEETRTRHYLKALVNVMTHCLPEEVAPYVHLGATSADILDTAQVLRIKEAMYNVLLPRLAVLEQELITRAEEGISLPQVGRTHGQHALPVTWGFALSEYVARLGKSIEVIEALASRLKGQLSGAVGGYHALALLVPDPLAFEKEVLARLGLSPSEYSSQIAEPEPTLRLLLECNVAFGILANLADDLRHLQRSEIDEIAEEFTPEQVGSSTMPQKRNPWKSEQIKGLWKTFSPRIVSLYMDQITEHQRDLSNSSSSRFYVEYLHGFALAVERTLGVVRHLSVKADSMEKNLAKTGSWLLAEPVHILLAISGIRNSHEIVRRLALLAQKSGGGTEHLEDLLKTHHPEYWLLIEKTIEERLGKTAWKFFKEPAHYRGKVEEKTRLICVRHRERLSCLHAKMTAASARAKRQRACL